MNKYLEAFERLVSHTEQLQKFQLIDDRTFNKGSYEQDKETIKELVDKATPRKPLDIQTPVVKWGVCPTCKGKIGYQLGGRPNRVLENQNYCSDCGQAIDWSDERC